MARKTNPTAKLKKQWKKLGKSFTKLFWETVRYLWTTYKYLFLMVAGIILVLMSITHNVLKWNALRLDRKVLTAYEVAQPIVDAPHPTHIYIQWFVDTDINDGVFENNNWTIDDKEATYLQQSARPGYDGNIIIYGHNTRQILGNIRSLKGKEKIKLTLSDGSERWYQVSELHQVNPDQIKFLEPTTTEVLTLYTCAGFADKDRFIVRAIPIDTLP